MGSPGYNIKDLSQVSTPDTNQTSDISSADTDAESIAEQIKETQDKLADPEE